MLRGWGVRFRQPPKELDGVVCEHFEDVRAELGKQLSDTASFMNLLASRR